MEEKIERKIKLYALDPAGMAEGVRELDYYNLGYEIKPPEEYEPIIFTDVDGVESFIPTEPMKKVRYLLTMGEHKYLVNRKGEILEDVSEKWKDSEIQFKERPTPTFPEYLVKTMGDAVYSISLEDMKKCNKTLEEWFPERFYDYKIIYNLSDDGEYPDW